MIKVSDYVWKYLKRIGVSHAFTLTGGGIMHLVDSLGRSGIEYVCCHHEQAAGIAAQAYGMYDDFLGVCLVTTGPGGTNALTACGAAYMDSTPMLFISGQVKRSDFASIRNVRQFGAQENDIISMAKPVTKYAVLVQDEKKIAYELERCVYEATHGRKGPVWMDIPLDVQDKMVDEDELVHFEGEICGADEVVKFDAGEPDGSVHINSRHGGNNNAADHKDIEEKIEKTVEFIKNAKRPLILLGHGSRSAASIVNNLGIPVLTTWRAMDLFDHDDSFYFGSPGLQAPRYSNLLLQTCDFLLVLGSRLDNMITAFNERHFAYRARKVIVDIDENEIKKLDMPDVLPVVADAGDFLKRLKIKLYENGMLQDETDLISEGFSTFKVWRMRCEKVKEMYPILNEKQDVDEGVNLYHVTWEISKNAKRDDVIVISSTSRCNTAGHIAFMHKKGQRTISSMGYGSMGFALPSAVGAWAASGGGRVIVIEGDGSLQLNIQELITIVSYGIDAKIFIFDNRGYAAITTMQDRNFDGFYVGSNEESGVVMPELKKIAYAYGIEYAEISEQNMKAAVERVFDIKGPVLCRIEGSLKFDEIPKCISKVDERTGERVSAFLENPYPFLGEDELKRVEKFLLGEGEERYGDI